MASRLLQQLYCARSPGGTRASGELAKDARAQQVCMDERGAGEMAPTRLYHV